jgi:phage terminase small subunit
MKKVSKKEMSRKADLRRERFPYEFIVDLNATQAAIRCGCSPRSARTLGARLFAKADVQAKIQELWNEIKKRALKTAEDWEREVDLIAFFRGYADFYKPDGTLKDIKDLTPEQLAVVHEIEHSTIGVGKDKPLVRLTNLKLYDKLKALDLKGKRLGIYKQTFVVEDPYMKYLAAIEQRKQQKQQGESELTATVERSREVIENAVLVGY